MINVGIIKIVDTIETVGIISLLAKEGNEHIEMKILKNGLRVIYNVCR